MVQLKLPTRPRRGPLRTLRANWGLLLLCLPALICYIVFHYVPMVGLILPFKQFKYNLGLFGSNWAGLKNFEFLFRSPDLYRIVSNTVGYGIVFMVVDSIVHMAFALLLFEISRKRSALKAYQTIMTFPNFMSWVIVGFITYAVLNPSLGVLNHFLRVLGHKGVDVYTNPAYWPFILPFVNAWKGVGMGSMMYLAALLGIDASLYEAATIDGANRWQQTFYISLQGMLPLWSILTIMAMGNIFRGDFGLFYEIPRNVSASYSTTDIIDTYVYRGLKLANFGMSSSVGFIQSLVGLLFVGIANFIVGKLSPENAMF